MTSELAVNVVVSKVGELELTDDDPNKHPITNLLLDWIESYWLTNGSVPSLEVAKTKGIREDLYTRWLRSYKFRVALVKRGVRISLGDRDAELLDDEDTADLARFSGGLSEKQAATINILTDTNDSRSYKMKLSELDVSTQQYQAWLRDPVFAEQLNRQAASQLSNSHFESDLALLDKVRAGDLNAIKYYDERTNRYVSVKDRASSVDIVSILMQLSEIIEQEVPDQEVRRRIATRLGPLIAAAYGQDSINRSAGAYSNQ